ncbi:hypothetical protein BHM03_00025300 [Ensete ventricosum]|nr:hypothetical protein BHM03_00025300 [Ensete ventricosum]
MRLAHQSDIPEEIRAPTSRAIGRYRWSSAGGTRGWHSKRDPSTGLVCCQ